MVIATIGKTMCAMTDPERMDDDHGPTSIQVQPETWRDLNALKNPGDSFDDVIQRLLSEG